MERWRLAVNLVWRSVTYRPYQETRCSLNSDVESVDGINKTLSLTAVAADIIAIAADRGVGSCTCIYEPDRFVSNDCESPSLFGWEMVRY